LALVQQFGILGVALGTAVPNLLFNAAMAWYGCRSLQVPFGAYLSRVFLAPLIAGLAPVAVWSTWHLSMGSPRNWPDLVACGALGVVAFGLLAAVLEPDLLAFLRRTVRRTQSMPTTPAVEPAGQL
jgi:hypothetical protein